MNRIKTLLSNKPFITDLLGILIITFAIVLIINGIILMHTAPGQDSSLGVTSQFATSVTNSIPGIPFAITQLAQHSLCVIGLASWITGLNSLLLGLGIWIKHRIARIVGLIVFIFASFFQAGQFLLLGIVGSPISFIQMAINIVFVYMLFFKFDYKQKV